jgi:putative ABC transport system substrate-binding protein
MSRRAFIKLLGGAATWPMVARAQQGAMPAVAYLTAGRFVEGELAGFQQGFKETGLVEGRDFGIEYHSTSGQSDRLPAN